MLNARRLSKLFHVAICCGLAASGLESSTLRADAAQPSLLEYFYACGIGDDAFAKFADDRQIAAEELDVIRRVAVRLRDCPMVGQIANLPGVQPIGNPPPTPAKFPSPAEAQGQRGQMFELQGFVTSLEPVEAPGSEPLWRCTIKLSPSVGVPPAPRNVGVPPASRNVGVSPASSEFPHHAVVYVAQIPQTFQAGSTGQRVAVDGVFVKYIPGPAAERMAVVVAPRLQWRADSPLGNLGMDYGLLAAIKDAAPLTAADRDAFYRLLQLARNADPARLSRDAERLDTASGGLPALFHDPAAGAPSTPGRGRLVRLSGTACRVVRVPIDDPAVVARLGADHYFEIDLMADGAQNNPLVFCSLDLPDAMPLGEPPSYGERMDVTGFFLKNWQYPTALSQAERAASPGSPRALQTAPLLIGPAPNWKPAGAEKKSSTGAAAGGFLVLAMIGGCLLLWAIRQSDQEFFRRVIVRE